MATLGKNLKLEIAHFVNFREYVPNIENLDDYTVNYLLKGGQLQVSTCFESALASVIGTTVISENAKDLATGEDAKLSTVRSMSHGNIYSAPVTNISGKTGDILVQVYERIQSNFYYFRIPNKFYKDIPASSNIEIPFELDGTPRCTPKKKLKYANWWDFERDSFEDLCKLIPQDVKY